MGGAVVILTLAGLVVNTNGVTADVTLLTFVPGAVVDGLVAGGVVLARGSIVTVLVAAGVLLTGADVVGAGVVGGGSVVGGGVGAGVCTSYREINYKQGE